MGFFSPVNRAEIFSQSSSNRTLFQTYVTTSGRKYKACSTRVHFLWHVFQWPLLFARISEKICPNSMRQTDLLKNWRASFYVAKKNCYIRKFVRVHDPSQKTSHLLRRWQWLLRFCLHCHSSFLAHRQTSFQNGICCLYTRTNIFVTENLPQKIYSCGIDLSKKVIVTKNSRRQ